MRKKKEQPRKAPTTANTQPPVKQHHGWRNFWIVLAVIYAAIVLSVGWFWHTNGAAYKQAIGDGFALSKTVSKATFYPKQPTKVLDQSGTVMKTLTHTQSTYISYKKINPLLTKGLIAVEDKRFYEHHGVDPYGILRGIYQFIRYRQVQGGSTLTQQLVKNVVLKDQTQSPTRKVKEMVIAQQLEKKFTKHQLLEFYLNDVYLGHGCYGIGSAAQYYFSKDQKDLTLPELALLIGVPNNQVLYDPLLHPQAAKQRRDTVLMVLYQQNLITKKQFKDSVKTTLGLKIHNFTYNNDISGNYALRSAINDATEELMRAHGFVFKYGFDTDEAQQAYTQSYNQAYSTYQGQILNGGYTIKTTINQELQNEVQAQAEKAFTGYQTRDAEGKLQPQLSMTIIDNNTGNILAVVGGRTTENDYVNRAYYSNRQPGSAAKPLIAYAPAFERGYTPQSTIEDSPISGSSITNWYSGYKGVVTLREALSQSINTVAYKLAASDPDAGYYKLLQKMEFSGLTPADKNPIIAIGGFTNGVTTTEMASAYSSFSRSGEFVHPTNITEIYDTSNQQMIYQNSHTKVPIYSANASYMMLNTMQTVITEGTGKAAALDNYSHTAGKTGTTDNTKDSYFVGMTPSFTVATWVGHDKSETLTSAEAAIPMAVFKNVGTYLVDYLKEADTDFEMPSTIKKTGDNLVATKESKKMTPADIIAADNKDFINTQIEKNDTRIDNLDYRLVYHLSKTEEQNREQAVKDAIALFDASQMAKASEYTTYMNQLQRIRYKNQKVRHMAAKRDFDQQILQLQKDLNVQKATLDLEKENKRQSEFNQKKAEIESERNSEKADILADLRTQYNTQLTKTKSAYQNNDADKETQRQKLIDIMNQIRSYGGSAPDITINGTTTTSSATSSSSSSTSSSSR
ncbi:transglycosylase domain-containing protein [Agrilactobacillus yilanensis]|uniref:Transglycosylase domain-containing protein n=1 Tax=Agrilactobacillus yilanensis TaxID=2485997 RepID=A0ABW4JAQ3_9LACO|nr:transglycosylase domain-containing protein [Agrilactobacillus yilanensis]